jgi:hypothetical protein
MYYACICLRYCCARAEGRGKREGRGRKSGSGPQQLQIINLVGKEKGGEGRVVVDRNNYK